MNFLYHSVPSVVEGSCLLTLNMLRGVRYDLWKEAIAKYEGREHIRDQFVTEIGCNWGDVLFLCVADPRDLHKALAAANVSVGKAFYYCIPLSALDLNAAYLMKFAQFTPHERKIKPLVAEDLRDRSIPKATLDYFAGCGARGVRPLRHWGSPQVLYRSAIDISKCLKILA